MTQRLGTLNASAQSSAGTSPWQIPLSDLAVDDEMVAAVQTAVASGWWSMGPRVQQFEEAFARFCGSRHALAVSSGTAALHLALSAAGCGPGDEVILPALNFVAAANVVLHTGAVPVFCDILGVHDLNLDPDDVARLVTGRTKAILALHYGGYPCDMDALQGLARRHGLALIEDAAHAPGARLRDRMCGTLGDAGCFSFFANKNLAIGEGGMVVTDDPGLAERMRLLRSHGMTTLTWERHRGHAHSYDVVLHGHNYRLDEIRAALGLVQLGRLAAANDARRHIARRYRELLEGVDGVELPFADAATRSAHHLAVAVLDPRVSRERVQTTLQHDGVQTSVHYPPIHRFSAYAQSLPAARGLPVTDALAPRLLTLPLYPHLREDQVERVACALGNAVSAELSRGVA